MRKTAQGNMHNHGWNVTGFILSVDVSRLQPPSTSTALCSVKLARNHSFKCPPREMEGRQGQRGPACLGPLLQAARPCWSISHPHTAPPLLPLRQQPAKSQTSGHLSLYVCSARSFPPRRTLLWIKLSPPATVSQVAFRIRKSKKYIHRCSLVYVLTLCNLFALICFCLPWDFPF